MPRERIEQRPPQRAAETLSPAAAPPPVTREDFAAIYFFAHFAPQVIELDKVAAEEGLILQQRALLGMAKAARTMAEILFAEQT